MQNKKFMGVRILFGLSFIIFAILAGVFGRSPFLIILLAGLFLMANITGDWPTWRQRFRALSKAGSVKVVIKNYISLIILVGVLYIIGLGLGQIFSVAPIRMTMTEMDGFAFICGVLYLVLGAGTFSFIDRVKTVQTQVTDVSSEGLDTHNIIDDVFEVDDNSVVENDSTDIERDAAQAPNPDPNPEHDLIMSKDTITPETFYHGRHWNVSNHAVWALQNWPHDVHKPVRDLIGASAEMIAETEARLGFILPDLLKTLYKIRNGGSVHPGYWVAAPNTPKGMMSGSYDDWVDAFANDYNDLRKLTDLELLIDGYEEDFDPDYDDADEKKYWFPEAEKLVVLTRRYGVLTALDYRKWDASNKDGPSVILLDLENDYYPNKPEEADARIRQEFPTFEDFFKALRKEADEAPRARQDPARFDFSKTRYTDTLAHQFWGLCSSNSTRGITDQDWAEAEARLKVTLPPALKPIYQAMDGGVCAFPYHISLPKDDEGVPKSYITHETYGPTRFLPIGKWVTLAEYSDRIDFQGATPYAKYYEAPQNYILLMAQYDGALMLKYSDGQNPHIVYTTDLLNPETELDLGDVDTFLKSIRRRENLGQFDGGLINDVRLSPQCQSPETFWIKDSEILGATESDFADFETRFGKEIPKPFQLILSVQNGGDVRFRYAPAIGDGGVTGQFGTPRNNPYMSDWEDMFPGGVWPTSEWTFYRVWRQKNKLAQKQDYKEKLMPDIYSEKYKDRLIVIGASDDNHAVTLMDLSEGSSSRMPTLGLARYIAVDDAFYYSIAPTSMTHVAYGILDTLRARLEDV